MSAANVVEGRNIVSVDMPPELVARLRSEAKRTDRTVSSVVRRILAGYFADGDPYASRAVR